ncbi:hypothetical protein LINGRAPRIM_LOCUS2958 [Linum grandiflorum]
MMKLLRNSPVPAAAMARNALKMTTIARNINVGKEQEVTKRVSKEEEPSSAAGKFKASAMDSKKETMKRIYTNICGRNADKVEEMTEQELVCEIMGELQELRKGVSDMVNREEEITTNSISVLGVVKKVICEVDEVLNIREKNLRRMCLMSGVQMVIAAGIVVSGYFKFQG